MVNFWFNEKAPMKGFGHLLWVFVKMDEQGEHGLGLTADMEVTRSLGHALSAHIQESLEAHYVARIRGQGDWQLYFYGRRSDRFEEVVDAFMTQYPGRKYAAGDQADPEWEVFRTFLFPDEERLRWILDNRVVELLEEKGDPLTEARRVDHWIYFTDRTARDQFEAAAAAAGFEVQGGGEITNDDGHVGIQVHREDFVDIERIHAVVMELKTMATRHGGDYDGWETAVLGRQAEK
jgi:regulator of RNase E activity RraB